MRLEITNAHGTWVYTMAEDGGPVLTRRKHHGPLGYIHGPKGPVTATPDTFESTCRRDYDRQVRIIESANGGDWPRKWGRRTTLDQLLVGLRRDYEDATHWAIVEGDRESILAQRKAARRYRLALWAIGFRATSLRREQDIEPMELP